MNPALIKSLGQRYGIPIAAVGAATVARMLLNPVLGDRLPFATFFLAIVFAAWYGGFGPALLSTLLSGLAADFIFLKPRGSFQIEDAPDQISLGLYFLVGLSCAWLGGSLHAARRRVEASEAKLRRMNETLAQHVAERTAELAESEERFRALYEQAAIGIEMLDFDGRLQKGNDKLCQILGFSQAELRQRDISELTHPEDLVHQQPLLQRLLAGEIPSFSIEKRYLHREGHPVWAARYLLHHPHESAVSHCSRRGHHRAKARRGSPGSGPATGGATPGPARDRPGVHERRVGRLRPGGQAYPLE